MRNLALIWLVGFSVQATALGQTWSAGTGLELRGQQDVNPQYVDARVLPQLFAQYRFYPYTATVDGGYQQSETNSGALSIATKSLNLGLWGRYEFREPMRWSPFVGLGLGSYFDTVNLNYGDGAAATQYGGRRDYMGIGAGINHAFFNHFLQELETRAVLIEDRKDVTWTLNYRLGFVY